jgi:thioredoxin 1
MTMGDNIITLTKENFDERTKERDTLILVDFWAQWCGPCRAIAPILERLAGEYPDKLTIGKLNVDEQQDIAIKYGITGIPTIKIFKNGAPVEDLVCLQPYQALKGAIDRHL